MLISLQNSNFSLQKVKSQDNGNGVKENAKVRYERLETGLSGEEKGLCIDLTIVMSLTFNG